MAYKIIIANEKLWLKDLTKIPSREQKMILDKIENLSQKLPQEAIQVKKLINFELADYRLRIGNYRILFDKDDEQKLIILFRILHRSHAY